MSQYLINVGISWLEGGSQRKVGQDNVINQKRDDHQSRLVFPKVAPAGKIGADIIIGKN